MKLMRTGSTLVAIFNDGSVVTNTDCDDRLHNEVLESQDNEEKVLFLLCPTEVKVKAEYKVLKDFVLNIEESSLLIKKNNSVYFKKVSELSLPTDFVKAILIAEQSKNKALIESYRNFWTLMSMNPDSRARANTFWFLTKYGMTIAQSGLFVAFRRVVVHSHGKGVSEDLATFISDSYTRVKFKHKKSPRKFSIVSEKGDGHKCVPTLSVYSGEQVIGTLQDCYESLSNSSASVYTDQRTHSFRIRLGEPVTMQRDDCDPNQDNSCSKGLHVASLGWLKKNLGFGSVSLLCLINPADVVAVPPVDGYGKMRTCAYYPVSVVQDLDSISDIESGFEDDFMEQIIYSLENTDKKDDLPYVLEVPNTPEIGKNFYKSIKKIKASIQGRVCNGYKETK
ncbi:hypothetical protein N9933_01095 [bacterium]|nr:hypothetical protein [bacterium]